ncbi:hypothetical protein B0O99DRAFT_738316 [Bisporella sp. PMI_857]|nr:hypothetical protein B0O99DRAFT_738316 [Bisporella sp. PMI_857]
MDDRINTLHAQEETESIISVLAAVHVENNDNWQQQIEPLPAKYQPKPITPPISPLRDTALNAPTQERHTASATPRRYADFEALLPRDKADWETAKRSKLCKAWEPALNYLGLQIGEWEDLVLVAKSGMAAPPVKKISVSSIVELKNGAEERRNGSSVNWSWAIYLILQRVPEGKLKPSPLERMILAHIPDQPANNHTLRHAGSVTGFIGKESEFESLDESEAKLRRAAAREKAQKDGRVYVEGTWWKIKKEGKVKNSKKKSVQPKNQKRRRDEETDDEQAADQSENAIGRNGKGASKRAKTKETSSQVPLQSEQARETARPAQTENQSEGTIQMWTRDVAGEPVRQYSGHSPP